MTTNPKPSDNAVIEVDAVAVVAAFYDAFEADPATREERIAETFAADVVFSDPVHQFVGIEGLGLMAEEINTRFPDARFNRPTKIESHHRQIHFHWSMDDSAGERVVSGHDLLLVGEDGRITHDYSFFD